jgi:hypothetical protein
VCPFLASPRAKYTALKEYGGPSLDRTGLYLGNAQLADYDYLTLKASFYAPAELLEDRYETVSALYHSMPLQSHEPVSLWDYDEPALRKFAMAQFESINPRMYHRVRQGRSDWY